jgi:predicted phosphodiesterase
VLYDLCSDLHFDSYRAKLLKGLTSVEFARLKNAGSQVLVVAGDSANHYQRTLKLIRKAAKFYEYVVFVDGNHEHYESKRPIHLAERYLRLFSDRHPNLVFLDGQRVLRLGQTVFIGCNGWYDWQIMCPEISFADQFITWSGEQPPWYKGSSWERNNHGSNDRDIISRDLPIREVILAKARMQADLLRKQVAQFSADPTIREIVVTTHTAPGRFCLEEKPYDMEHQRFNGSYANSRYAEVLAVPNHKIKLWNYGHTHNRKFLPHDCGVIFVNNARGYASEQRNRREFEFVQMDTSGL